MDGWVFVGMNGSMGWEWGGGRGNGGEDQSGKVGISGLEK